MIVTLHVATGALAGNATRSRRAALLLGPLLHALGDVVPHEDIASRRFETASGIVSVLALAAVHGPLDPVTLGAVSASAPDLEHVLPLPRPGGKALFPTHRGSPPIRPRGLPAWVQLALAGAILARLLRAPAARRPRA
ncbi:MAG TPA: hypothetical protein VFB42_11320 [Gaiellaceae bacterium]|nr:hypothetical protein [Gaiellaceae bacterium]